MRQIGEQQWQFPDFGNLPETERWEPSVRRKALASRVLAVASTRIEGAWAAYIDAVPGRNHDDEQQEVLDHGEKLSQRIALVIFPEFSGVHYAR